MKTRFLLLLFLLGAIKILAQENKGFTVDASFGISVSIGDYKTYTKALGQENEFNLIGFKEEITGQTQFKFDAAYYFNDFGAGATFGFFNHEISSLTYEVNFPIKTDGGKISGSYYGIGPNYTTSLGALNFTGLVRGGLMNFSLDKFIGSYNGTDVSEPVEILNTEQAPGSKSSLPYASLGVKLSYPVYEGLSAFIKAEYLTSFGDGFKIKDRYVTPHDTNNDGSISSIDIEQFVNSDHLVEEMRFLKPQMLYFGLGIGYSFGDTAKMPVIKETTEERKDRLSKETKRVNDTDSDGDGLSDEDFLEDIVFENANNKRSRPDGGNVIVIWPINNHHFTETDEIEKFSWELQGNKIENPNFRFEIFNIGDNQELQSVYVENTTKTETNHEAAHILQQKLESSLNKNGEGHYKWIVTETTTGITSNDTYFSFSKCDFDFRLINETVECISSDTDNRVLKICFDSYFSESSTLADLYFGLQSNALILYDQNNNALTHHLVNPNQSLMPQSAFGGSTLYCLEVIVPNGVTSVTIRMQGEQWTTGTEVCTPIAYLAIDNLPYCACNDCANQTLVVKKLTISQNGTNSNQFNISGNLSASPPIFGIEFQIQSYRYAANPSNCTDGVTSIEESGMFLIPATTVNNASVTMFNESISSSGNTNNLTAKTIQYMSTTPITGFPVSLTIGVPGPSAGQNPSTCKIEYKVRIKAKVYFENGSCKSCVFSDWISFNN